MTETKTTTFDENDWPEVDPIYGGPVQRDKERGVFDLPAANIRCDACGSGRRLLCRTFDAYFSNGSLHCDSCGVEIDFLGALDEAYQKPSRSFYYPLALVGATVTTFRVPLLEGEPVQVVLSDFGIPEPATRLEMDYGYRVEEPLSPDADPIQAGSLIALESGNTVRPRRYIPHVVELVGRGRGKPPFRKTSALITVVWTTRDRLPPPFDSLLESARLFYEVQIPASMIWANTAVESALSSYLELRLIDVVGRERVESFLVNAATYSHQLNVVLPLVAKLYDLPLMPEQVRGKLNSLNRLRNKIVHEGLNTLSIDYREAGSFLVTAVVAAQLVRYLGQVNGGQ
jgi:hypothetical protein